MPIMKKRKFDPTQMLLQTRVAPNTMDIETRTVELVWSMGTKGLRRTWFGDYYEELSMEKSDVDLTRLNSGAPLLASHNARDLDATIGVVERAWIDGVTKEGKAIVRFAKDDASEVIFQKVKDGILRNISVGYDVSEYDDVTQDGDDVPTYRAVKWEPMEVSIVPIGFDKHAQVRTKGENDNFKLIKINNHRSSQDMDEKQLQELKEKLKHEADENARKEIVESIRKGEIEMKSRAEKDKVAAVDAEKSRGIEIRKIVKDAGLDAELAEEYVSRNISVEDAKTNVELFKKYASDSKNTRVSSNVDIGHSNEGDKRDALETMLLHRLNSSHFKLTDAARAFAGKSLIRALEDYVGRNPYEDDFTFAKRAMTTSDLPLILANVAEKSAQKRYELTPKTFTAWTSEGTLRNYKEAKQLRSGDIGSLKIRNEKGEYEYSSIGEEQEVAQLEQYGIKHAFSDKMVVDDDLGMILQVANETGRTSARLENKLAYDVLKNNPTMGDSIALFDASHGNLGTVGAIGETTFAEAFKDMRNQTSVDGRDILNLAPRHLIVGPELEVAARKFLATNLSPTQSSEVNVFAGSTNLIVDAEISDDKYFFVADQNLIDTVKVFRLEGQSGPRVSSRVNWDNDCIELKIAHSVDVAPMDFRGLYKNKAT